MNAPTRHSLERWGFHCWVDLHVGQVWRCCKHWGPKSQDSEQPGVYEGLLHLHTWHCSISEHEIGIAQAGFLSLVVKVTFITSRVCFNLYQSRSCLQTLPRVITLTPHFCLLGSASLKGLFAVHLSIYRKLSIELCQMPKKLYERSVVSISYLADSITVIGEYHKEIWFYLKKIKVLKIPFS